MDAPGNYEKLIIWEKPILTQKLDVRLTESPDEIPLPQDLSGTNVLNPDG